MTLRWWDWINLSEIPESYAEPETKGGKANPLYSGELDSVLAELARLLAGRLCAGVELVEVLVGALRDHQRPFARAAVGMRGVERRILGLAQLIGEHDSPAPCVAADCLLDFVVAEQALVAPIGGIPRAQVCCQLDVSAIVLAGLLNPGHSPPAPTGCDWQGSPISINRAPYHGFSPRPWFSEPVTPNPCGWCSLILAGLTRSVVFLCG